MMRRRRIRLNSASIHSQRSRGCCRRIRDCDQRAAASRVCLDRVRASEYAQALDRACFLPGRAARNHHGCKSVSMSRTRQQYHLDLLGVSGESITVNPNTIRDETEFIEVIIDVPLSGNTWISPLYFNGTLTARTRMLADRAAADMAGALNELISARNGVSPQKSRDGGSHKIQIRL